MVFRNLRRIKEKLEDAGVAMDASASLEAETGTPEGRIPIGDGWYRTPEIIDPRDPINYPDSPWNGGNPINSTPLALDLEASFHPCGFDLSMTPTIGFMIFPTAGLSYRFPGECRNEPPQPKPGATADMKETPMNWDDYGAKDSDVVIATVAVDYYSFYTEQRMYPYPNLITGFSTTTFSAEALFPVSADYDAGELISDYNYLGITTFSREMADWVWGTGSPLVRENKYAGIFRLNRPDKFNIYSREGVLEICLFRGLFSHLKRMYPMEIRRVENSFTNILEGNAFTDTSLYVKKYKVNLKNLSSPPYSKNPPPPPDEEKECCMECCSQSNQQQQDYSDLLRKILKKVENIEKRVGCDDYPFTVPKSLVKQSDNWLANILPTETKQINNTQEFIRHLFLTLDELLGEFEIPIEIKDTDPTKPGEQPSGMKILNVAEGISELAALSVVSSTNSEVAINMMSRILYELAALRQSDADGNSKTKSLIDFFGFKTKDVQENIKLTFTPGTDKLDEMLVEKEHPITVTIFDDVKQTYKHDAAKLLEAAAITKAVNSKKINIADAALAAADIAKNVRELAKNKKKQDEVLGKKQQEDFDEVIDSYEKGFIDTIGIDDSANPYGEPYASRPKVRKLDPPTDPTAP